jgi:hypothetical protein
MIIDADRFNGALTESERTTIRQLGLLTVTSGRIVACDPLVFPGTEPFDVLFPAGTYPVHASVAHLEGDERIAFARVQFADETPIDWQHVAQPGADFEKLEYDEYFGYAVDAGIGCFMDVDASRALIAKFNADEMYYEEVLDRMAEAGIDTCNWAEIALDGVSNMICFTSGFGDGFYPSFVGYGATGRPVCLLTDFMVLD